MSRLLFAAARGARLQVIDAKIGWCVVEWTMTFESPIFRIHPDDEHLQYGPISTALRELAAGNTMRPEDASFWRMARDYYITEAGVEFYTLEERCLFLLILAEALADKGL